MRRTDLLFHAGGECLQQYGSLIRKTSRGEDNGYTHTRSGAVGPYTDSDGVLRAAAANTPRVEWLDLDGDGEFETPAYIGEPARTNLVDSDAITGWSTTGTPVITGSIDGPAGGTGAYTVEDNDATNAEYPFRNITFTGDGTKAFAFVVRQRTMASTGVQRVRIFDTTAAAVRLALDISAWVSGNPTVTASTGTLLGKRYLGNGYWVLYGRSTSITAANTNRVEIRAAVDATATGSIDVYRVNAFNNVVPSHSIVDAGETRNADLLYGVFDVSRSTEFTAYIKSWEAGTSALGVPTSGAVRLFEIGSGNERLGIISDATSNRYRAFHTVGGSDRLTADSLTAPTLGQVVEHRVVVSASSYLLGQSTAGGTESTASGTAGLGVNPWGVARLHIGCRGTGDAGLNPIIAVKVARGVQTLADMRAV